MNGIKRLIIALLGLSCFSSADPLRTDFIRVDEDEQSARLQTAITRYSKDGVHVDLIGAVHIADQTYFEQLNQEFQHYDAVLFEMIGGERMVDGQIPAPEEKEEKDPTAEFLHSAYKIMENMLKLSGQKNEIDYSPAHFVHADLSMKEFQRLQKEKKESLVSFAMQQSKNAEKSPDSKKLFMALLSGNADRAKLAVIDTLGQGDDQVAKFAGDSVIIGDRNAKCFEVLAQEIKVGKKKLSIFYGAAHLPDMEERLLKQGYQKVSHRWLTAWDVKKPEKKAKAG